MKKKLVSTLFIVTVIVFGIMTGCGASPEKVSEAGSMGAKNEENGGSNERKDYSGLVIRVAEQPEKGDSATIGEELGFWEDEFSEDGITVEIIDFASGPAFVEAIATDQIDIGKFGDQPIISGYASGKELTVIGSYDINISPAIYARKSAGIETVKDLKGKTVAYLVGANSEKALKVILEKEGIDWDEINAINLSSADSVIAFETGDVDAVVYYGNFYSNYEDTSDIVEVANYNDYGTTASAITVSNSFKNEYPELVVRVLKVYQREAEWLANNSDEAIGFYVDNKGYSEENAEILYAQEIFGVTYNDDIEEAYNFTAQFLYDNEIIDHEVEADEFVDLSFLKEAGIIE